MHVLGVYFSQNRSSYLTAYLIYSIIINFQEAVSAEKSFPRFEAINLYNRSSHDQNAAQMNRILSKGSPAVAYLIFQLHNFPFCGLGFF
jgi:hypothetical protein